MASRHRGAHRLPSATLSVVSSVRRHPVRASGTVLGATVLVCLAGPAYASDSETGTNPPLTQGSAMTEPAPTTEDAATPVERSAPDTDPVRAAASTTPGADATPQAPAAPHPEAAPARELNSPAPEDRPASDRSDSTVHANTPERSQPSTLTPPDRGDDRRDEPRPAPDSDTDRTQPSTLTPPDRGDDRRDEPRPAPDSDTDRTQPSTLTPPDRGEDRRDEPRPAPDSDTDRTQPSTLTPPDRDDDRRDQPRPAPEATAQDTDRRDTGSTPEPVQGEQDPAVETPRSVGLRRDPPATDEAAAATMPPVTQPPTDTMAAPLGLTSAGLDTAQDAVAPEVASESGTSREAAVAGAFSPRPPAARERVTWVHTDTRDALERILGPEPVAQPRPEQTWRPPGDDRGTGPGAPPQRQRHASTPGSTWGFGASDGLKDSFGDRRAGDDISPWRVTARTEGDASEPKTTDDAQRHPWAEPVDEVAAARPDKTVIGRETKARDTAAKVRKKDDDHAPMRKKDDDDHAPVRKTPPAASQKRDATTDSVRARLRELIRDLRTNRAGGVGLDRAKVTLSVRAGTSVDNADTADSDHDATRTSSTTGRPGHDSADHDRPRQADTAPRTQHPTRTEAPRAHPKRPDTPTRSHATQAPPIPNDPSASHDPTASPQEKPPVATAVDAGPPSPAPAGPTPAGNASRVEGTHPTPATTTPHPQLDTTGAATRSGATAPTKVAGPHHPAPAPATARVVEPVGPAATTVAPYPDVAAHPSPPSWVSGLALGAGSAADLDRMRTLAGARGHAFDVVSFDVPARSWDTLTAPVSATLRQLPGRKVVTVPLVPEGASLSTCAKGDYHSYWTRFATNLRSSGASPVVSLDGFDPTDTAAGTASTYAGCFRQVAAAVRKGAPQARIQWNVLRGEDVTLTGPASSWPGRAAVDIIGVDAVDAGSDWARAVNGPFGLTWWTDFAARQGRQVAIAPWGHFPGSTASALNAAYVQNMRDFLVRVHRKNHLAYEVYDATGIARGAAAQAYRKLF